MLKVPPRTLRASYSERSPVLSPATFRNATKFGFDSALGRSVCGLPAPFLNEIPCHQLIGSALYQREVQVVLIQFATEDGERLALEQHGFLLAAREQF